MQPPSSSVTGEQQKCWHMLGKKFDWFQTGRNICQHHTTQPNMVYKRTQHVVPNMLAQHVAFVCTGLNIDRIVNLYLLVHLHDKVYSI